MLLSATTAAKRSVMNSLRRVSHQVIRPEQSLKIAVHQPAVPVGPAVAVTTRGMSMVDQLNAKERIEEERYMRELEAKHAKATQTVDGRSQDEQDDWDSIAPVMMEVKKTVLQSTNDAVSDAGLEALARWKLGLPQVKKDSVKPD